MMAETKSHTSPIMDLEVCPYEAGLRSGGFKGLSQAMTWEEIKGFLKIKR